MDGRRVQELSYDDGTNAWRTVRVDAPASLAAHVYGYADYRERTGGFTARRELPHAEGVLIVNLGDRIAVTGGDGLVIELGAGEAFVAGAHLRPAFSRSSGSQAGVHVFLPLTTLRRLLRAPMSELIDRVVSLDALLGRAARELGQALGEATDARGRIEVLDAALTARLRDSPADARQGRALSLLRVRPDWDIAEVASRVGWSRKHLADRVRDAIGVGPRSFRRLLRFQALTGAIGDGEPDWAALAHDAGYCDQSHMIREFREFSGMTPGAYAARRLPEGGGLIEG